MAVSIGELEATLRLKDQMSGQLKQAQKSINMTGVSMSRLGAIALPAGAAVAAGLAVAAGASVKLAMEFEDSFAGVRKTVKATEPELQALAGSLRGLAKEIPVNVNELNSIAQSAGQLGIKTGAISGFTDVIARLGVSTNLSTEKAATSLARLANIMGTSQTSFENMGSSIVDLGNNFATTEAEIVEFGLRIAGAGKIAGLSEAQVLGIGAAMSSVGIQAEAGGTAVQKVLNDMTEAVARGGEKLATFARTAGVSSSEFQRAFGEDAGNAFAMFVEGLGRQGNQAFETLDKLKLGNERVVRAFVSLAGAGDLLRDSMTRSTSAWRENSALQKESQTRFETTSNQIKILWNRVQDLGISIGNALLPAIKGTIAVLNEVIPLVEKFAHWVNTAGGAIDRLESRRENKVELVPGLKDATGTLLYTTKTAKAAADTMGAVGDSVMFMGRQLKIVGATAPIVSDNLHEVSEEAQKIQESMGINAARDLVYLREAWGTLPPKLRSTRGAIDEVRESYAALRDFLQPSQRPIDFEKLFQIDVLDQALARITQIGLAADDVFAVGNKNDDSLPRLVAHATELSNVIVGLPTHMQGVVSTTHDWRDSLELVIDVLGGIQTRFAQIMVVGAQAVLQIDKILKSNASKGDKAAGIAIAGLSAAGSATGNRFLQGAAGGAAIGNTIVPGIGAFVGAGIGALTGLFGGDKEHMKVNDMRDAFIKAAGGLHELNVQAKKAGVSLDELLRAKNVEDYERAVENLNRAFDEHAKKVERVRELIDGLAPSLDDITGAFGDLSTVSGAALADIGVIAVASIGQAIEAGYSLAEAVAMNGESLGRLHEAYEKLGIAPDPFLKMLMTQGAILQSNPALVQGVGALGSSLSALAELGSLNAGTFAAMQRTVAEMFTRLQAEAAKAGGSQRDALLPMQEFLHQAEKAAKDLGVPLDENTQMLIDQSKELGIWKDAGKTATDRITEGIERLIEKMDRFIERIGAAGDAMANMPAPRWPDVPSADQGPGFAGGTHGQFVNWGSGTNVRLHGYEAIVPRGSEGDLLGASGGGMYVVQSNVYLDGDLIYQNVSERMDRDNRVRNRLRAS